MFPDLDPELVPVRLAITATIPVGTCHPAVITLTCDPPSDRYAVVWYQDVVTDVLTPEEAITAIDTMVHEALGVIATGRFQTPSEDAVGAIFGRPHAQVPGQLSLDPV